MPEHGLYETALAGLLHDIGKFLQRRGIERHHAEVAREYRDYFKSENVSGIDFGLVLKAVSNHHSPTDDFERLISMADGLSASERDETDEPRNWQRPLASIFEQIELSSSEKFDRKQPQENNEAEYFYPIQPLSNKLPYPSKLSKEERDNSKMADYRTAIEDGFLEELDVLNKRQNSAEAYFDTLFTLLKKYTTLVPSSTGIPPDISLFEHLKTTAAIACALHQYEEQTRTLPKDEEKAFLLVGFELSGIQEFIYTIRTENAAKSLRGRSFYVKLLSLVIERYLLDELGLLAPNIVMSGGGRSYLLAANTEKTLAILEAAKLAVQRYLLSEFEGRLGASLEWTEFSGNEFGAEEKGSFADVKERLDKTLRAAKSRKFIGILEDYFKLEAGGNEACPVCNCQKKQGVDICEKCDLFVKLGQDRIRSNNFFVETYGKSQINVHIRNSQHCFAFLDKNSLQTAKKVYVSAADKTSAIIGTTNAAVVLLPYPLAGEGKTFQNLADMSDGIPRLGFLKMDVDNLGKIFAEGLGKHSTICRISTLSFLMDYFFTVGVEEITKEKEYGGGLYLVYSGGDDLFLIGAWNKVIKCACRLREKFGIWSCSNQGIGLSAGIVFSKDKFPLYMSAEGVAESLEASKSNKYTDEANLTKHKDSVTAFSGPLSWDYFRQLIEVGTKVSGLIKDNKITASLTYSILQIKRMGRHSRKLHLVDYLLCRNVQDDGAYQYLKAEIPAHFYYLETPVQYAVWQNRQHRRETNTTEGGIVK